MPEIETNFPGEEEEILKEIRIMTQPKKKKIFKKNQSIWKATKFCPRILYGNNKKGQQRRNPTTISGLASKALWEKEVLVKQSAWLKAGVWKGLSGNYRAVHAPDVSSEEDSGISNQSKAEGAYRVWRFY